GRTGTWPFPVHPPKGVCPATVPWPPAGLRAPGRQDALVELLVGELPRRRPRQEVRRVRRLQLAEVVERLVLRVTEGDEGEEDRGVGRGGRGEGLGRRGLRVRSAVRLEHHQRGGVRAGARLVVQGEDLFDGRVVAGAAHPAEGRVQRVDPVLEVTEGEVAGAVQLGREEDDLHRGLGVEVGGEGERLLGEGLGGAVLVVRAHGRGAVQDEVHLGAGAGEVVLLEGGGGGGVGGGEGGGGAARGGGAQERGAVGDAVPLGAGAGGVVLLGGGGGGGVGGGGGGGDGGGGGGRLGLGCAFGLGGAPTRTRAALVAGGG